MLGVSWLFRAHAPPRVDTIFRLLQFVSASLYSLGHGGNDAQKTMGIIAVLLFAHGDGGAFHVPLWVVCLPGGDGAGHPVRRLADRSHHGVEITRLTPIQGFCAETGGAITLFLATGLGVPVSTTHTITGAIVGVGAAQRLGGPLERGARTLWSPGCSPCRWRR